MESSELSDRVGPDRIKASIENALIAYASVTLLFVIIGAVIGATTVRAPLLSVLVFSWFISTVVAKVTAGVSEKADCDKATTIRRSVAAYVFSNSVGAASTVASVLATSFEMGIKSTEEGVKSFETSGLYHFLWAVTSESETFTFWLFIGCTGAFLYVILHLVGKGASILSSKNLKDAEICLVLQYSNCLVALGMLFGIPWGEAPGSETIAWVSKVFVWGIILILGIAMSSYFLARSTMNLISTRSGFVVDAAGNFSIQATFAFIRKVGEVFVTGALVSLTLLAVYFTISNWLPNVLVAIDWELVILWGKLQIIPIRWVCGFLALVLLAKFTSYFVRKMFIFLIFITRFVFNFVSQKAVDFWGRSRRTVANIGSVANDIRNEFREDNGSVAGFWVTLLPLVRLVKNPLPYIRISKLQNRLYILVVISAFALFSSRNDGLNIVPPEPPTEPPPVTVTDGGEGVPVGPTTVVGVEKEKPKFELKPMQICNVDNADIQWLYSSSTSLELKLRDCKLNVGEMRSEDIVIMLSMASSGLETLTEEKRSENRSQQLATWMAEVLPSGTVAYVLDLGEKQTLKHELFGGSVLQSNTSRSLVGGILHPIPYNADVTVDDILEYSRTLWRGSEIETSFSNCQLNRVNTRDIKTGLDPILWTRSCHDNY